jgi:hypothetical protein
VTQLPYDEFSKQIAEVSLELSGQAEPAKTIPGETREIDFYFSPSFSPEAQLVRRDLGLLGRLANRPSTFEFFHNPVELWEIRSCMGKTAELERALAKSTNLQDLHLWIVTPTLSAAKLQGLGASANLELSTSGVFDLAPIFRTSIVVVHQLPKIPDTLWLRIFGRGKVFLWASQEIAILPSSRQKAEVFKLLGNLKTALDLKKNKTQEEEEVMIQLQPAFIAQLEQAKSQGRNEGLIQGHNEGEARMLLGLLQKRLGACPEAAIEQIYNLNSAGLEALSDVFLGLADMAALQQWLSEVSPTWQKAENS